ncbi:MAG: chemotaxis-specific protein-glutamate methyltransferase CheB [Deltaproteobacteria bacterium]|nr:chemotaxis-specific protein-glutamate methyltransferase CheB [Deltaproteobacteria bacterium]
MAKTRVLVVDDSRTVRGHLVDTILTDPDLEVAGEAETGKQAIELCLKLRPDVITLDMMMPVMSGLAATEYIMAHCPTPILVVSASVNRGELFKTYEALSAGAVDVLDKPRADGDTDAWARRFLSTVKLVARIRVITHPRARLLPLSSTMPMPLGEVSPPHASTRLIAIGASTGGPGAVVEILRSLPETFDVPILLVVHIGQPFADAFAEWLDGQSSIPVRYAKDAEICPTSGTRIVLMAPPERHLVVRGGRLHLTRDPERHSCRPSIDVLFESIAREVGSGAAACLLTGMGRDGASGLLDVRRAGGRTVAQDEETSVVFGMPREAILLGAAERILPIGHIAPHLATLAPRSPRRPA